MNHYLRLDWPQIPEDLEKELIDFAANATSIWQSSRPSTPYGYSQFDTPDSFKEWAYHTLPIGPHYKIIMQQYYGVPGGNIHTDKIRNAAHNYLLLPNKGRTSWYDTNGNMLESVQYEQRVWYWHDSLTQHQVTNVDTTRLAVSIYESLI